MTLLTRSALIQALIRPRCFLRGKESDIQQDSTVLTINLDIALNLTPNPNPNPGTPNDVMSASGNCQVKPSSKI